MINIFNLFMLQYIHSFFYGLREAVPVKTIASDILQGKSDRKTPLRALSTKWMEKKPPLTSDDYNIASYFFARRTKTVSQAVTGAPYKSVEASQKVIDAGG
jgi:hypothetical protein